MTEADYHSHSLFSDGKNSPEEMVLAAISAGLRLIGFAEHSYVSFDPCVSLMPDRNEEYKSCIAALKEKYAGQIEILCGLEQDYYSDFPALGFDSVIGSVHYIKVNGTYYSVDHNIQTRDAAIAACGGDPLTYAELYFANVADVVNRTGCDIIGHFDLLTKFEERSPVLDTASPRYIAAWKQAADALLKTGKPFEINTGAISRGYRTSPYPARDIVDYLKSRGAGFVYSGDCHSASNIGKDYGIVL